MKASNVAMGLFVLVLPLVFTIMLYVANENRQKDIASYLTIAEVAVDEEALEAINDIILSKKILPYPDIVKLPIYQKMVGTLNEIRDKRDAPILWTYIMLPLKDGQADAIASATWDVKPSTTGAKFTAISVLTIEPEEADTTTHPGTLFAYDKYPALTEILETDTQVTVSKIVYDSVYKAWIKSGFIKILNGSGDVVGVLGIDVPLDSIILDSIIVFTLAIIYSGIIVIGIVIVAFFVAKRVKTGGKYGIQNA